MAARKFLFMAADGFHEEAASSDTTSLGGLTMSGNIGMGGNKVTGAGAATASGDALVYGQSGASLVGLASTGNISLSGGATLTGLPTTPTGATEAVSKAYADNIANNVAFKGHVSCLKMVDDQLTTAPTLGTGDAGKAYVVAGTGGDWSGFSVGDIVEWSGTAWALLTSQSGGEPPDGIRVIVDPSPTAGSSFAGHAEDVGEYDADTDTWSFTDPVAGETRAVQNLNGDSIYEFLAYTWDAQNSEWVLHNGAGQVNAGLGLTKVGNTLNVGNGDGISVTADAVAIDLTGNGGLELTGTSPNKTVGVKADTAAGIQVGSGGVGINLHDTNPGLEFDGVSGDLKAKADTTAGIELTSGGIAIDLAATNPGLQFDGSGDLQAKGDGTQGIVVGAGGIAVKVETDGAIVFDGVNGGLEINLEATNPTLDITSNELGVKYSTTASGLDQDANGLKVKVDGSTISINGSGQLYALGADEAKKIENELTALNALTAGDPVYLSSTANNVDKADAGTDAKAWVMGIARTAISQSATGPIVSQGPCASVLSGATPGAKYYLGSGGGLVTAPPSGSARVILVGWALNTTDLWVHIHDYGKKSA